MEQMMSEIPGSADEGSAAGPGGQVGCGAGGNAGGMEMGQLVRKQLEALEAVKAEADLVFDFIDSRHQLTEELWKVRIRAEEAINELRFAMGLPPVE